MQLRKQLNLLLTNKYLKVPCLEEEDLTERRTVYILEENIILAIFYFILSAILFVSGYILYNQKVSRNSFFGVRFPKSLKSDKLWYSINQYGGKRMMIWSVVYFVLGCLYVIFPYLIQNKILLIGGLLIFIITVIETYIFSTKL